MAQGHFGRTRRTCGKPGVVRDAVAGPERQTKAGLQIDEHHSPVLELRADDAVGRKAETVTLEAQRRLEIVDAQREHGDSRFHGARLLAARRWSWPSRCRQLFCNTGNAAEIGEPGHRRTLPELKGRLQPSALCEAAKPQRCLRSVLDGRRVLHV